MKTTHKALLSLSIIALAGAAIGGYYYTKEDPDLTYFTTFKWEWQNEGLRIQKRLDTLTGIPVLRKVNRDSNSIVYLTKQKDYSTLGFVVFPTQCTPRSVITTTKEFSNGQPKTLTCSGDGDALMFSIQWSDPATDFRWIEDLDGFKVNENLALWDFTEATQRVTLQKAK